MEKKYIFITNKFIDTGDLYQTLKNEITNITELTYEHNSLIIVCDELTQNQKEFIMNILI